MPNYNYKEYIKIIRPLPKQTRRDKFGIPFIEKQDIDITKMNNGQCLINMHNTSINDKNAEKKIVHSFSYDKELLSVYNNPIKFIQRTAKYNAISSLDFSMDEKMTEAQIINATFSNRWFGAFAQSYGRKVIPTVGWVYENTYDICFSGLCDGGVFIISTLGADNPECREVFLKGYRELRRRFPNTEIISVGNRINGMDNDVCYVTYKQSFGNQDRYSKYWQPMLLDWRDLAGGKIECNHVDQ